MTKNKVALVTGGSRGIGRAIAIELARGGFDLAINYASDGVAAEEARELARSAGRADIQIELLKADISDSVERAELLKGVKAKFGRLDVLVNNAGVAPKVRADLLEASEDSFDRLISINLKAPYFLSQAAARWMIEQRTEIGDYDPSIINITSISAYTASPERGDYCVAKAGLSMMTALYASRLAAEGINVYEVRPGIIATDMTSGVTEKYDRLFAGGITPIARWGQPEDVGRAVAAVAGGAFRYSTGEVINVDGGFHLRRL